MRRRALLATVGAAPLAGCGWSRPDEQPAPGESTGEDRELASSEGGGGPIEASEEELLLRLGDLESPEWRSTDVPTTETCNTFERTGDEYSMTVDSCAAVYADESTAEEEHESALDRSLKTLDERLDAEPDIGDEAAFFNEGRRANRIGESVLRLVFRDSNATGRLEFVQNVRQGAGSDVPEVGVVAVSEWGARMHARWRS